MYSHIKTWWSFCDFFPSIFSFIRTYSYNTYKLGPTKCVYLLVRSMWNSAQSITFDYAMCFLKWQLHPPIRSFSCSPYPYVYIHWTRSVRMCVWVPVYLCLSVCVFRCALKCCYFYGFPCATIVILSIPADRHICFVHVHRHCIQEFPNELFRCAGMNWCLCLRVYVWVLCDSDTITSQEYKNRTCGHGKKGQRTNTNYM